MTTPIPSTNPAPGTTSLPTLLSTLTLTLHPSTLVFATYPPTTPPPQTLLSAPTTQLTFREPEGTTIITTLETALEHHITDYTFPCRMITCNVHSSLEAVGFMAVITTRLAELGMGMNPVSGFFHDHLFVPVGREAEAIRALEDLAKEARTRAQREAKVGQGG